MRWCVPVRRGRLRRPNVLLQSRCCSGTACRFSLPECTAPVRIRRQSEALLFTQSVGASHSGLQTPETLQTPSPSDARHFLVFVVQAAVEARAADDARERAAALQARLMRAATARGELLAAKVSGQPEVHRGVRLSMRTQPLCRRWCACDTLP